MTYAEVDPIIASWVRATVAELFSEWDGQPARFAYLPGLRPFECFQISVEAPMNGRVAVRAVSVDTDDGSKFEQRWKGAADTLATMLDTATNAVRGWVNRPTANGS